MTSSDLKKLDPESPTLSLLWKARKHQKLTEDTTICLCEEITNKKKIRK
jgi:hypothetical protein